MGKRASGQKLIPIPMTEGFIESIDRAFRKEGYSDRSKFIRDAVKEKLIALGYPVKVEDSLPPTRIGKGGPRKRVVEKGAGLRYSGSGKGSAAILNEQTDLNSKLTAAAAKASNQAELEGLHHDPKLRRSAEAGGPSAHTKRPSRASSKASKDKPSPPGSAPKSL